MEFRVKITLHTKMSPRWIIRVKDEDLLMWSSGKVFGKYVATPSIVNVSDALRSFSFGIKSQDEADDGP